MVEITEAPAGKLSGVEWMTTVAFLGALYCVVLGIFKRFSANFSLGSRGNDESGAVQPRMGVYRNLEYTTYSQINEVPAQSNAGSIKTEVKASGSTGNNVVSGSSAAPKTKLPIAQGVKEKKKTAAPEIPKATTTPAIQQKKTKSTAPLKPTNEKDKNKNLKDENAKIEEKLKQEKAAQLKQDKKLKEKRDKEEKSRKEKEAKEKEKNKGKKEKAPIKPAAGATAVKTANSTIAAPKNVPTPMTSDVSKQGPKIATGSLQELSAKPAAVNNAFTSSWDLVAEHRQNMQRELQTTNPGKNLRSIASQNTNLKREVNMASNNASGGLNISQRYSDGSDTSNTDA